MADDSLATYGAMSAATMVLTKQCKWVFVFSKVGIQLFTSYQSSSMISYSTYYALRTTMIKKIHNTYSAKHILPLFMRKKNRRFKYVPK